MWVADNWKEYRLLDASDGERLERWGKYTLVRPDPQVIWKSDGARSRAWNDADAVYRRSSSGGGAWNENRLPAEWTIGYGDLKFVIRTMGFKHTGIFPEQAVNWDWARGLIEKRAASGRRVRVLNLFAYTGGATVSAAAAGAEVCHVDAAKGMVATAKENAALSGLADAKIRYIVDDCRKFVEREIRRGSKYEAIIMDPPSYGRGPGGEVWKIEDSAHSLIKLAAACLSDDPLFFLINSYTAGLSPLTMKYMLDTTLLPRFGGRCDASEIALRVESTGCFLPCGSSARWSATD